jgi:hypothetical protein
MSSSIRDLEVTVYATRKPELTRRVEPTCGDTYTVSSDNDGKNKNVNITIRSGPTFLRASATMFGEIEMNKQAPQTTH